MSSFVIENQIEEANSLLEKVKSGGLSDEEIYNLPFPMGVFGTLRQVPRSQGNNRLMHLADPVYHSKAFVRHLLPSGIWVEYSPEVSGIFEIFFYDKKGFDTIIGPVDNLEGFYYGKGGGYYRTLVEAHLIPENEFEKEFSTGIYYDDRDLKINPSQWDQYPTVPCWVYANIRSNNQMLRDTSKITKGTPVLWTDSYDKQEAQSWRYPFD